jgi:hypothetical protein
MPINFSYIDTVARAWYIPVVQFYKKVRQFLSQIHVPSVFKNCQNVKWLAIHELYSLRICHNHDN